MACFTLPPTCVTSSNHVKLLDTTLRDGLSNPNILSIPQHRRLLKSLQELHPHIIEVTKLPFLPLQHSPIHSVLTAPTIPHINRAFRTVSHAPKNRIHLYTPIPGDSNHIDILQSTKSVISHACTLCEDVQYTPMHGVQLLQTRPKLVLDLVETAVRAGARTITLADTRGEATPTAFRGAVTHVTRLLEMIHARHVEISVHAHGNRDHVLGNVVEAVHAGANVVECTVSGVGFMPALQDVVRVFDCGVRLEALDACVECFEDCFGTA